MTAHLTCIWSNLTCPNPPTNLFPVALTNKSTTPLSSTLLFLDLSQPLSLILNPALLSLNLHLFKDPLPPPSHQSTLESLLPIPSPANLTHQEELFKQLQDLPPQGYLTSTTNPKEWPRPKVWLPKTELVSMYELHNMLNDLDQQNIFIDAINLMGNECDLLSCWWHFDHCINTAIRLETEAETQWITAKNLFERLQLLKIDEKLRPIIVME